MNGSKSMSDENRDELLKLVYAIRDGFREIVKHAQSAKWFNRWLLTRAHKQYTNDLIEIFDEILQANPQNELHVNDLRALVSMLRSIGYVPEQPILT
jgi:hypothetical protein